MVLTIVDLLKFFSITTGSPEYVIKCRTEKLSLLDLIMWLVVEYFSNSKTFFSFSTASEDFLILRCILKVIKVFKVYVASSPEASKYPPQLWQTLLIGCFPHSRQAITCFSLTTFRLRYECVPDRVLVIETKSEIYWLGHWGNTLLPLWKGRISWHKSLPAPSPMSPSHLGGRYDSWRCEKSQHPKTGRAERRGC